MKLEQLMKREEFVNIFDATLRKYFSLQENWNGEFSWGRTMNGEGLNLLVNEKINIIFPSHAKPADIRFFVLLLIE